MKQERCPAWSRDSHQAGMLGKGGLLGRAASRFDLSRKERHPRELRDGWKYREHVIRAGRALSTPSALLQALTEFVEDTRIHPVQHEHEDRTRLRERHDDPGQAVLDGHQIGGRAAVLLALDSLGKTLVSLLAPCAYRAIDRPEHVADIGVIVTSQQVPPRPVFEGSFFRVVCHHSSQHLRGLPVVAEAAHEAQGHLQATFSVPQVFEGGMFLDTAKRIFRRFERSRLLECCRRSRGEAREAGSRTRKAESSCARNAPPPSD